MSNGRPMVMLRCDNDIYVKKNCAEITDIFSVRCEFGKNIFQRTKNNEKIGLSIEDSEYLEIKNHNFIKIIRKHRSLLTLI